MAGGFEVDLRRGHAAGEFPGIAEQVFEHRAHQARVALDTQPRGDVDADRPRRVLLAELLADHQGQRGEVHRAALERLAADPRQREQVVDQLAHAMHGGAHPAQQLLGLVVQVVAVVGAEDGAVAFDGAQRRAQVVGDRIAEGFELVEGCAQLRGALGHPPFEFKVEALDGLFGKLAFGQVGAHADDVGLAVQEHPAADHQEGHRLGVVPPQHDLHRGLAGAQRRFDAVGQHGLLLGDHQAAGLGVLQLGVVEAGELADEAVPQHQPAVLVEQEEGRRQAVDEAAGEVALGLQLLFGPLAGGDVAD